MSIDVLKMVTALCPALLAVATIIGQTHNTLLIVADDFGVDSVGAYNEGANPPPTPNIDALAKRGVLFRNAYSGPVCSVTRACLHTGRYGFRTGVGWVIHDQTPALNVLSLTETTLPEVLTLGGMNQHALIGKWHLGNAHNGGNNGPNLAGWSHFDGMIESHPASGYYNWNRVVNGVYVGSTTYATTALVNSTLQWIGNTQGPWFCMLSFQAPHWPYHTPPSNLSQLPTGTNRERFRAMSEAMDTEIGRLFQSLPAATMANTNVIFLGDNGTDPAVCQSPFLPSRAKLTVYEGGINVPLIVAGPAVVTPGREVLALVDTTDLFAAVPELFGITARTHVPSNVPLDAVSFVPYLKNPNQVPLRETVYAEQYNVGLGIDSHTIRNERYKLYVADSIWREEFYDLKLDPFEKVDLLVGVMSAEQSINYRGLAMALARLRAEPRWLPFGTGCQSNVGMPTFAPVAGSTPWLGTSFSTQIGNLSASATAAVGMLGVSNQANGSMSLPFDLGVIGLPGCWLYSSIEVAVPLTVQAGAANWVLAIPNLAALQGSTFFQQGLVIDPTANGGGLVLTRAAETVIGR